MREGVSEEVETLGEAQPPNIIDYQKLPIL